MAQNSKIEWTHHTVNLWWGCSKVHAGCDNCYAEYLSDTRYKNGLWGNNAPRKQIKKAFSDLDKFQKLAAEANENHRVFAELQKLKYTLWLKWRLKTIAFKIYKS